MKTKEERRKEGNKEGREKGKGKAERKNRCSMTGLDNHIFQEKLNNDDIST